MMKIFKNFLKEKKQKMTVKTYNNVDELMEAMLK